MMRVIACFASTLDGRIGSVDEPRARVGSAADLQHLLNVRNQAEAILCGGETFRHYQNVRRGSDATHPIPLQCILTRSVNLPVEAALFQSGAEVPIVIFTPEAVSETIQAAYPAHVQWQVVSAQDPVPEILAFLEMRGVNTLLVEGGGHVMNLFLHARAVQELYLTLCPLLLGGECNPKLVTGQGFTVTGAPRTEIMSMTQHDQELYLHLQVIYPH